MEARGANGIAEALDATNANANAVRENDVLIKCRPSARWLCCLAIMKQDFGEAIASVSACRLVHGEMPPSPLRKPATSLSWSVVPTQQSRCGSRLLLNNEKEKAARRRLLLDELLTAYQATRNATPDLRRYAINPTPKKPRIIIAQVEGSGTAEMETSPITGP
jgi:hypothetical protein